MNDSTASDADIIPFNMDEVPSELRVSPSIIQEYLALIGDSSVRRQLFRPIENSTGEPEVNIIEEEPEQEQEPSYTNDVEIVIAEEQFPASSYITPPPSPLIGSPPELLRSTNMESVSVPSNQNSYSYHDCLGIPIYIPEPLNQ